MIDILVVNTNTAGTITVNIAAVGAVVGVVVDAADTAVIGSVTVDAAAVDNMCTSTADSTVIDITKVDSTAFTDAPVVDVAAGNAAMATMIGLVVVGAAKVDTDILLQGLRLINLNW